MKLEAVDKSNASLICVATVNNIMDGRVLIHFDGWENDYDYWITPGESALVHPIGYCQEKQLLLNPPKGSLNAIAHKDVRRILLIFPLRSSHAVISQVPILEVLIKKSIS